MSERRSDIAVRHRWAHTALPDAARACLLAPTADSGFFNCANAEPILGWRHME